MLAFQISKCLILLPRSWFQSIANYPWRKKGAPDSFSCLLSLHSPCHEKSCFPLCGPKILLLNKKIWFRYPFQSSLRTAGSVNFFHPFNRFYSKHISSCLYIIQNNVHCVCKHASQPNLYPLFPSSYPWGWLSHRCRKLTHQPYFPTTYNWSGSLTVSFLTRGKKSFLIFLPCNWDAEFFAIPLLFFPFWFFFILFHLSFCMRLVQCHWVIIYICFAMFTPRWFWGDEKKQIVWRFCAFESLKCVTNAF